MPDDFSSEDSFGDEEEAEIDQIIASGREIKLEKKKKPRKLMQKTPKIEVTPVLKEAMPTEKVSYVISTENVETSLQVKTDDGKITLTKETKTELKPVEKEILTSESEKIETSISEIMNLEKQEQKPALTAHDILTKSEKELKAIDVSKRETHNLLQDMRIITAILLGKKKNKELSQVLQTDKSFTSKQIKDLEEQGLVKREGEGKDVSYEVDTWNMLKFLQSKVVIKWKKEQEKKSEGETK